MSVVATDVRLEVGDVEEAIEVPFHKWARECHSISLAIVQSDLIDGPRRVARGACDRVPSQHSWIVVGDDCYADDAVIIDPTLWSYDDTVKGIWYGSAGHGKHHPHGCDGTIWMWGKPSSGGGEAVGLSVDVSPEAASFLELCGPLDFQGWGVLASHAPVAGWPAAEIFAAMDDTPGLRGLVPIDRLGMLTDRNPDGLYLPVHSSNKA